MYLHVKGERYFDASFNVAIKRPLKYLHTVQLLLASTFEHSLLHLLTQGSPFIVPVEYTRAQMTSECTTINYLVIGTSFIS